MKLLKIALAGISGTTLMTLFSYVLSIKKKKQFKEPEILNKLLKRADLNLDTIHKKDPPGWVLHYLAGLSFSLAYDSIWRKTGVTPTMANSLIMGTINGLFGILVWKAVFKLHPNPPNIHFSHFYRQLLIAHVIFGLFAKLGYQLPETTKRLTQPVA